MRPPSFWKWAAVTVAILVLAGGFILIKAVGATQPLVDATAHFFALINEGRIPEAYALTSEEVQSEFSVADFESMYAGSEFRDLSWSTRRVTGDLGYLLGTVVTNDVGNNMWNAEIILVRRHGAWRIYSVDMWQ